MVREKLGTLVGIMLLLALYFWGHNVGESSITLRNGLSTTVAIAGHIGIVAVLLAIAGGIGRRLLQALSFDELSIGERVVIDSLIGLGSISLLAATLGLLGQFNIILWGVLLVVALIVWRSLFGWLADVRDLIFRSGRPETPWERFVRVFVLSLLLGALMLALAPPFAWDAINYHLLIPERYIADGAIQQHLDNHFFGFPQNFEMLYGLLMMLGSDHAPAVLHFMLGVMGLVLVYNVVQRHASSKAAAVSVLLLMASFNIWLLMGWAYVDLALMAYGTGAIVIVHHWLTTDDNRQGWLILTIILLAMAAGIKYTAIPLIIGIYLLVALRERQQIVRNTLLFAGFGVLVFLPWLVKGALLYENPLYPYLFDGPNWDSVRSANFGESGKGLLGTGLYAHIPLLPFTATIFGIHRMTPYSFTVGPFLLTLPFLLVIGYRHLPDRARELVLHLLPVTLVILLFWMVSATFSGIGGQTRLMLVGMALPAILGGLAYHSLEHWKRRPIDIVFIVQAVLIFGIFLGVFDTLKYFAESRVIEYHANVLDEDRYLQQNLGQLYDAMLQLESLPAGSRVLFLWEPKTYHCPDDIACTGDLLFDNWARPVRLGTSPQDLIAEWQAEYDYVLFFDVDFGGFVDGYSLWSQYHEFAIEQNELFSQFFFDDVREVWSDEIAYTLYTWR